MPKLRSFERFQLGTESTRRLAFVFTIFLLAFEVYFVSVKYSPYFLQLIDNDGLTIAIDLCFFVTSLCLVYLFIQAAFSASSAFRPIYFLIFSAAVIAEYSYQKAFGRFTDVFDITLAIATTPTQKLSSIGMYFGFAALVPCLLFLSVLIFTRSERETGFRKLLLVNMLIITIPAVAWAISTPRFPSISAYAFYRTNVEFALSGPFASGKWGSKITGIELRRKPVESLGPDRKNSQAKSNVVFVVDESVRGDHLSVNGYQRDTTPFLAELHRKGLLHNWGIAAAASTSSQFSYNALITGLRPDDFPDAGETKTNTSPTVFQYAKAAGYTTWFFDGQMDHLWGGIEDDQNSIDHWFGSEELLAAVHKESEVDNEIARRVNSIIRGSRGNFVFIFKHGLHTPYHGNFPADRTVWQPSYAPFHRFDIPGPERLHEIVNAYDNSIRYNLDSFFESLIDDFDRMPDGTTIVYTSDHGQTLAAEGRASHGGSTKAEATVPLFIIGRLSTKPDIDYKASHSNLLPTILDLIGYPKEKTNPVPASLSLLDAKASDSRPRFFSPELKVNVPFD